MKNWPSYLDLPKGKTETDKGISPIKSDDRDRTGSQYWKCPICGAKVGGYEIYGSSSEDWFYSQDNFCRRCGQKIEWEYEV